MGKGFITFLAILSFAGIMFMLGVEAGISDVDSLSNGESYNVIAIVDDQTPGGNVELVVADPDDPNDHHFVYISAKCYSNYNAGAKYLIHVTDDTCVWLG